MDRSELKRLRMGSRVSSKNRVWDPELGGLCTQESPPPGVRYGVRNLPEGEKEFMLERKFHYVNVLMIEI